MLYSKLILSACEELQDFGQIGLGFRGSIRTSPGVDK